MSLTVTINGVSLPCMVPATLKKRVSLRSTADLLVIDASGTLSIQENQAATVVDSSLGTLFVGYVDKIGQTKAQGSSATLFRQITLKDLRWLADKRLFTSTDYTTPRLAGDILCDLHTQYLSAEGVVSAFAQRYDKDATTWGAGTLTNVSGSSGALQLASAGSTVTINESTTATFSSGTLTNVIGSANRLILAPFSALKLTGYSAQGSGASNNNYYYIELWNGSASIGVIGSTNPSLRYQIWISSTSPAIVGGVDFICSDGTTLRSQGLSDHLGIQAHPGTDLSGYANDQWYSRTIDINSLTGKTINTVTMALEGDPAGTYTIYCASIALYDGSGVLQTTFFSNTMNSNMPYSNVGYSSVSFSVATVYPASGNRLSSNYSLTSAGIARSSLVTWQALMLNADGTTTTLADNAAGTNQTLYVKIEVSLDGGVTYQQVTNHTALSALMAGVKVNAQTLTFRETLTIAGTSPEVTPALSSITASVFPSYQATKTDIRQSYTSTWATGGTLSLTQAASDGSLQLQGAWRNWNDGGIGSQVVWGTGTPSQKVIAGQFLVNNTGPSTDVRSQFTFAGTWGPNLSGASTGFTMDVDFYINSFGNYGMVYGTTNWQNANNTFAYEVDCTTTTLTLGRGSNAGSSGSFTTIATQALGLTAGEWHHMTIIWFFAGGGNYQHLIYIDDVNYINVIDNTFTAHGYFGSRFFNNSPNHSAFVDNFGVVAATSGTWISNAVNLSSVGTAGNSLIMWNQSTPTGTSVLVEVSLNNGGTYTTCTNNAPIPGIANGTNVSAMTQVRIRITLTTASASYTPSVSGLTIWVLGQYSASGNRIAPVLSLGSVGTAGSTSVVWNATTPTNTSVLVDTSPDNITYTNIAASGNAIPNITTQPDPTIDDFLVNSSANYTQSSGTWTWDTANLRLVATVGPGKMVYTSITAANGQVQTIMDYADSAGLVARWTSNTNTYMLKINDASAASSANTATLSKIVAGTTTVLGSAAISFARGTYHTPTLISIGTTISAQFDGTTLISVTDAALSSGKMGFHVDTKGQFYTLWISPFGQSLTGQNIYSRVRLTSTDPTATPSVSDLTVSVRSPEIDNGASIPNTSWSYSTTLGAAIDDLAKKSNAWWGFTTAKHATFQTRLATLAPWPLASVNGTDLMGYVDPQVSYNSPSYRNRQYVLGATATQVISENKIGDGSTQSWSLGYPITPNTTPTITVGSAPQVVGLQGASGGPFDFTFTPGSSGGSAGTIIQSATATPPAPNVVIAVSYSAITPVTVQSNSVSQQTLLAGFDGSTGIVEAVETQAGLTQTAAQQLADARIAQYANLISTWQFTTRRDGLQPGQILYVFVPELQLTKVAFLITEVAITLQEELGAVKAVYNVSASLGPPTSQWARLFITPQ